MEESMETLASLPIPHTPPAELPSFFLHHTHHQQSPPRNPSPNPNPNPSPSSSPSPSPSFHSHQQEGLHLHQNDPHHQELDHHHQEYGYDEEEEHVAPPPSHHLCEERHAGNSSNFFSSHMIHIPSATRPEPNPNLNESPAPNENPNLNISIHGQQSNVNRDILPPGDGHALSIGIIATESPSPDPFRRKRGRPRKYSLDLNNESYAVPLNIARKGLKKARMMNASGRVDQGFRPHIIAIAAGEDLLLRMMAFLEEDANKGMCILSANGVISNVALASGGMMVTYEGRFDILSISGSFLQNQGGVVTVSLAGPDGRIIGGEVDKVCVAASPIKVVVGIFLSDPHETQTLAHTQTQEDSNQNIHTMVVKTSNTPFYEPVQKQSSIHVQSRVSNEPQSYCFTHAMSSQSLDWRVNPIDTNTHFKRGC